MGCACAIPVAHGGEGESAVLYPIRCLPVNQPPAQQECLLYNILVPKCQYLSKHLCNVTFMPNKPPLILDGWSFHLLEPDSKIVIGRWYLWCFHWEKIKAKTLEGRGQQEGWQRENLWKTFSNRMASTTISADSTFGKTQPFVLFWALTKDDLLWESQWIHLLLWREQLHIILYSFFVCFV